MATTITIGTSLNWIQAFGGYRSLTVGVNSEPAITSANIIIQTILAPPFSWNWNRSSASFSTTSGTQDYSQAVASFGFIEKASYVLSVSVTNTVLLNNIATYTANNNFGIGQSVSVTGLSNNPSVFNVSNQIVVAATSTTFSIAIIHANIASGADTGTATGPTNEITNITTVLGAGSESGSPTYIAPQTDDNAGNISFRLLPVPDQAYTVTVIFQKRIPSLVSTTSSTWAPIPDHYSMVYQWGYLALLQAYWNDPRWMGSSQKFVAELLGVAEGLSDEQRNIFQAAWLNMITEQQVKSGKSQQGVQARGSL